MKQPDYITPKLQTAFEKTGFHFMESVIAGSMKGFVQGVRPDGKLMISHAAKDCPRDWNVRFWKLIDYDPKDVQHV
jgi:hypothetical protein